VEEAVGWRAGKAEICGDGPFALRERRGRTVPLRSGRIMLAFIFDILYYTVIASREE
jgi:hypothetical protein